MGLASLNRYSCVITARKSGYQLNPYILRRSNTSNGIVKRYSKKPHVLSRTDFLNYAIVERHSSAHKNWLRVITDFGISLKLSGIKPEKSSLKVQIAADFKIVKTLQIKNLADSSLKCNFD